MSDLALELELLGSGCRLDPPGYLVDADRSNGSPEPSPSLCSPSIAAAAAIACSWLSAAAASSSPPSPRSLRDDRIFVHRPLLDPWPLAADGAAPMEKRREEEAAGRCLAFLPPEE